MSVDTNIFRVGQSDFYGDDILTSGQTHTPERLEAISKAGFSGIWLRGRLRELVSGELFRDYVKDVDSRMKALTQLCKRAGQYNLGVWLFFTEPLGLACDHIFWQKNEAVKGHKTKIMDEPAEYALCSSTAEVQSYLHNGFKELFDKAAPAGVILITASEQVNNCWAHVLSDPANYPCPEKYWADKCSCSRCASRTPAEVISEIINLVDKGVSQSKNPGKVVSWDWSWNMHCKPPYKEIVDKLNEDVVLLGDFERGSTVVRLGKERILEEYSLVCSGPSDRFQSEVAAYSSKRDIFAKVQINTTHELASVANLPLIVSLYRKIKYMNENNVSGTMACWNFGCFTDTLNVKAFDKFTRATREDEKADLLELAKEYFGATEMAEEILQCWYGFQEAVENYPVNGYLFLYWSPVNYALAYPLKEKFEDKAMGPSWLEHQWGDRLEDSLGDYSFEEMIMLLEDLMVAWKRQALRYQQLLEKCPNKEQVTKEIASAMTAGCIFNSVYNIYRWYYINKYCQDTSNDVKLKIVNNEIENLKQSLVYVKTDDRLGFHQEAQVYLFNQEKIEAKIEQLQKLQQGLR